MDANGAILIASPTMLDPNFSRAVIFICSHDETGAFGVVLNRPTDMTVAEHLEAWGEPLAAPAVVFWGGPVAGDHAVVLAEPRDTDLEGVEMVTATIALADAAGAQPSPDSFVRARVFAGYTGWSPNQLDQEVDDGDWFIGHAEDDDVFGANSAELWADVLRRRGDRLSIYANFPPDIRLN